MATNEQIKQVLKDNWIGKNVIIEGEKYEVVDSDKFRLQVIKHGKWSAKWVNKDEVTN